MSIGAFGRLVGLAPSALRFYDDCGVLPPASVDQATGYRYYSPEQVERAILVRRLRSAGLPLPQTLVVLQGSAEQARQVLAEHARQARESAEQTQDTIESLLREHFPSVRACARVGGPELAGGVRQVGPAAVARPGDPGFPALGGVLVELDRDEVRLVATDRFRLAVRTLRPLSAAGEPCRILVTAADAQAAAAWAKGWAEVSIEVDERGARLRAAGGERDLELVDASFPDYRAVLEGLGPARHRIITDRVALGRALPADGPVTLAAAGQRLVVGSVVLPAVCTGPPVAVSFDPMVLGAALETSVGPDILLEIVSATGPVVARSADQGSFTTFVMPVVI